MAEKLVLTELLEWLDDHEPGDWPTEPMLRCAVEMLKNARGALDSIYHMAIVTNADTGGDLEQIIGLIHEHALNGLRDSGGGIPGAK